MGDNAIRLSNSNMSAYPLKQWNRKRHRNLPTIAMETDADCGAKRCSLLQARGINDGDRPGEHPSQKSSRGPHGKVLQILAVVAANIVSISFGTVVGWSTAVEPSLRSEFSPETASWIVTISIPACIVGCLLWGPIAMQFGPRKSLLFISLPMIAGWILLLDSTTLWSVLVGRALCGLALGATCVAVPLYVSEIAEDSLRGRLGSLMSLGVNLGILVAYSLGGFLNPLGVAIFCGVLPVIFLALFFLCPDSPLFLFTTGREPAALETLLRLRGSAEEADAEITAFRAAAKAEDSTEPKLGDLFRGRAAKRAAVISAGVLTCQQGSGISPVMYYAGAIFLNAGGSTSPIVGSCIVSAVQLSGSCVATVLIDKAGRRSLMLISCIGMAFSQAVLGYSVMPNTLAPSWTPVISLSVYIAAYALGAGPAPFVIVSEVSAPRVKALACSVALAYNSLVSFILTKVFPDLSVCLGDHGVFWLFAASCSAGAVFCWFCLPETSGRSSESIQAELEGRKDGSPEV